MRLQLLFMIKKGRDVMNPWGFRSALWFLHMVGGDMIHYQASPVQFHQFLPRPPVMWGDRYCLMGQFRSRKTTPSSFYVGISMFPRMIHLMVVKGECALSSYWEKVIRKKYWDLIVQPIESHISTGRILWQWPGTKNQHKQECYDKR